MNQLNYHKQLRAIARFLIGILVVVSINLIDSSIFVNRVFGANSSNKNLLNVTPDRDKVSICIAGFCVNTPNIPNIIKAPIEQGINSAIRDQLRSFLSSEIPITGTEHKLYPSTPELPGGRFAPNTLYLSALQPSQVIPSGDYEIPVHFYCTKVYTLNGAGNRFRLARLEGRLSSALSNLYQRASLNNVPIQDVQVLSWSIQSGVSYDNLSNESKRLVDRLIPDYRQELNGSFIDQTIRFWNTLAAVTPLPSLDETLNQLGDVGNFTRSLFRAREEIIRSNFNYRNLANNFVLQQDFNLPGGVESTPWSQINDRVYLRFIAPSGALRDGVAQVRILGNSQDSSPITSGALLNDISQSVGIPEQSGQAITVTVNSPPEGTVVTLPSESDCNDNVSGFSILDKSANGVCLYKNGYQYVTTVDLSKAKLRILTGPKYKTIFGNNDRIEAKRTSYYIDEGKKSNDSSLIAILNGTVFDTIAGRSTSYELNRNDRIVPIGLRTEGDNLYEYKPDKLKTGFALKALCFNSNSAYISGEIAKAFKDINKCPNFMGLYASSKSNEEDLPPAERTFIGINNQQGKPSKVLFYSSSDRVKLKIARDILSNFGASEIGQLDGGGSTLLVWREQKLIEKNRVKYIGIPSAIAIYSQKTPNSSTTSLNKSPQSPPYSSGSSPRLRTVPLW